MNSVHNANNQTVLEEKLYTSFLNRIDEFKKEGQEAILDSISHATCFSRGKYGRDMLAIPVLQAALVIPYALIPEAKPDGSQASKLSMCRDSNCSRETQFFNRPGAVTANPYRNGEDSLKYVFPILIHLLEIQPENEKFTILQVITYLIHFMRQKYSSVFPQAIKQCDVVRILSAKANEQTTDPKHLHFYLECSLELVENTETRVMLKNSYLLETVKKQMKANYGTPRDEMEAKYIEKTGEVFAYIENVLNK